MKQKIICLLNRGAVNVCSIFSKPFLEIPEIMIIPGTPKVLVRVQLPRGMGGNPLLTYPCSY